MSMTDFLTNYWIVPVVLFIVASSWGASYNAKRSSDVGIAIAYGLFGVTASVMIWIIWRFVLKGIS